MVIYHFVSNLGLKTIQTGKFTVLYWIWGPFLIKTINKGLFKAFLPFSFFVPYRFYHFEAHLSNHFYRPSINWFFFIDQNDKGHLSVSAGVWARQVSGVTKLTDEITSAQLLYHIGTSCCDDGESTRKSWCKS